jgi:hypothetical protein
VLRLVVELPGPSVNVHCCPLEVAVIVTRQGVVTISPPVYPAVSGLAGDRRAPDLPKGRVIGTTA